MNLLFARLRAFLVDIFMINMPILYITTYLILGSKEAFLASQIAHFICFMLYGVILSAFFAISSQTPGYKYAQIALLNNNGKKVNFMLSLIRFIIFCASLALIFGFVFPFFRKDRACFHDIICKTKVIFLPNQQN